MNGLTVAHVEPELDVEITPIRDRVLVTIDRTLTPGVASHQDRTLLGARYRRNATALVIVIVITRHPVSLTTLDTHVFAVQDEASMSFHLLLSGDTKRASVRAWSSAVPKKPAFISGRALRDSSTDVQFCSWSSRGEASSVPGVE